MPGTLLSRHWGIEFNPPPPPPSIFCCSGVPCLCLGFWNTFIVSGFANGQLKLYDSESGVKVVEVTAHARPVVGLDVALNAGLVRKRELQHQIGSLSWYLLVLFSCCQHLRTVQCACGLCPCSRTPRLGRQFHACVLTCNECTRRPFL